MLATALLSSIPSIIVIVPFLAFCAGLMLVPKASLRRILAVTFNMWALFAFLFVCAFLSFLDYGVAASVFFWAYFGFTTIAMIRTERSAAIGALVLAFISCFAATKVFSVAAADHVREIREEARLQSQKDLALAKPQERTTKGVEIDPNITSSTNNAPSSPLWK